MPDPKLDRPLSRRPVRIWVGFLTGLLFGPLIAYLLVHAPSSEWLGPYPPYRRDMAILAALMGVWYGPPVGLAVPALVLGLQRWAWRRSDPRGESWRPEPEWPTDRPGRVTGADEHISRRTDITNHPG